MTDALATPAFTNSRASKMN